MLGPQISMTAGGAVTITGLTAEQNITKTGDVVIVDKDNSDNLHPFDDYNVTYDTADWDAADGGTLKYQLVTDWNVLNGHNVIVRAALSDGTVIESAPIALSIN